MKKIISAIGVVALISSVASAQLLKNFSYDGSIIVNSWTDTNDFDKDENNKRSQTKTRLHLNTNFELNDSVSAHVSVVKNNRNYGDSAENANDIQNSLIFEEAYLNLKGVLGMDHKLGRQFYGDKKDLVIYYGPKMWPYDKDLEVEAIDGFTAWFKKDNFDVHAILAREKDDKTNIPNRDIDIYGINAKAKFDIPQIIKTLHVNAYAYEKIDKTAKAVYTDVLGARFNLENLFVEKLHLGFEYNINKGNDPNVASNKDRYFEGKSLKLNAEYTYNLFGEIKVGGEYVSISGDNNSNDTEYKAWKPINSDYRPGIIYGGGFVAEKYSNNSGDKSVYDFDELGLKTYNIGVKYTPDILENKLTLGIKYYNFKFDKIDGNDIKDKKIGNEFDIVATWNHSDKVSLKGYYAMFKPEKKNLPVNAKDDRQTMLGAAFVVKF